MLDYYYGHQLYIATLVMFGAVILHLLLALFLPALRRVIGYSVLLFGVVLVLNLARYQYQLAFLGSHADGVVIEVQVKTPPSRSRDKNGGATFDYRPRIRFTTEEGQEIEFLAAQNVVKDAYRPEDLVKVRYMSAHPEFAEIDSWGSLWMPLLFGTIFDGLICFAGVFLIRRLSKPR